MLRNTRARWGALSQLFHWLIAALIGVQIALGLIGTELPLSMTKLATLARHKSLGITLLALMLVRLTWRALNPTPALPDTLKPHERVLARVTHTGLYVLVIALPLTGWIMSSARGFPVSWFNLFQLPNLVGRNAALYHAMVRTHVLLAIALGLILVLHIAAALKHHFVLKDDTLRRMLPGAGTALTRKE
ncbi:MAG: cytochrome b [Gammaproteobacteria bacterium]|nr:cytochrome b [Gammaproteobacteria bacterium]